MVVHGDFLTSLDPAELFPELLDLAKVGLVLGEKVLAHPHDVPLVLIVSSLSLKVLLHLCIDVKLVFNQFAFLLSQVNVVKEDDLLGGFRTGRMISR